MPAQTYRAFRKALQERAFAPVYLLHGDDDFLKDRAVRHLVEAAVEPGLRDFNLEVRRGAELDAETLGALLGTPPMMADRRVLVVRDVGALKKDARKQLDRYLANPAPDAVVVLVALAGKADKELLGNAVVTSVEYGALTDEQLVRWIAQYADEDLGGSITPEAATLLHVAVGSDLPLLAAELDKLLSYTNGAEVDEAAVSAIVGVRRGETLGDFLDAVGARDARRALDLLPHVLAQPKVNEVQIVMALATQTMGIAWAQAARAEGLPAGRLEGELFTLLKETKAFPMRPWGEATKSWARSVRHWTPEALDRALEALLEADLTIKETTVTTPEQTVVQLVLTLCAPDAATRRPAA